MTGLTLNDFRSPRDVEASVVDGFVCFEDDEQHWPVRQYIRWPAMTTEAAETG